MGQMKVTACPIKGLYIIEPRVFGDARGSFFESYCQRDMLEAGLDMVFVQDNVSVSVKGVLRGLHEQIHYPQGKLVQVLEGAVYDAVVDLRAGSETFGRYWGVELNAENHRQFYIPPGFAHGYLTLTDRAVFTYKVTDYYHPEDEAGLLWNDPAIGIPWPGVEGHRLKDGTPLIVNERDQHWPRLCERFKEKPTVGF